MAASLVELGPLAIGVDASFFQFYFGGISDPAICSHDIDHAILAVGYGTKKGTFSTKDYWIIKNSWGKKWGEQGYIRLRRGKGRCGVNLDVLSAVLGE